MNGQKLVLCIPLQPRYRRERLRWCMEHGGWSHHQWPREMFYDESRFTVISYLGHLNATVERGRSTQSQQCVRERDRYDSGMLVWVGIMLNAKHRFTFLSEATFHSSGSAI